MAQQQKEKSGYLEIFMGPMFSGKTSKLLEIYKQYKFCNMNITVINHSSETRYSNHMLSTHDKVMIPCIHTKILGDLWNTHVNIQKSEIILINEGQFFEDLASFVTVMLTYKKKVYIAGLDGDFERKKFGQILDLIPMCDKVTKLTSLCGLCKDGTPGIFSLRLTKESTQTLVGSTNYVPVCRGCYDSAYEKS